MVKTVFVDMLNGICAALSGSEVAVPTRSAPAHR